MCLIMTRRYLNNQIFGMNSSFSGFNFYKIRLLWSNFVFKIVTNFLSRPKSEPLKEKVLATTSENKKSIQLLVDQCLDKIENGSTIQCANGLQTIRQSFKVNITKLYTIEQVIQLRGVIVAKEADPTWNNSEIEILDRLKID